MDWACARRAATGQLFPMMPFFSCARCLWCALRLSAGRCRVASPDRIQYRGPALCALYSIAQVSTLEHEPHGMGNKALSMSPKPDVIRRLGSFRWRLGRSDLTATIGRDGDGPVGLRQQNTRAVMFPVLLLFFAAINRHRHRHQHHLHPILFLVFFSLFSLSLSFPAALA
ncbi:hypothetical protein V8C34DRAFT_288842 [Trichoderma compactum]